MLYFNHQLNEPPALRSLSHRRLDMYTEEQSTDRTQKPTVKERFDALFASSASCGESLETLIRRNARIYLNGKGSIVIRTPYYDAQTVAALKRLGARGRKIGGNRSTVFDWTITLEQLEKLSAYLIVSMRCVDGFLMGVKGVKQNQAMVDAGGVIEYKDLYNTKSAPVPGQIYRKHKSIHVCIRHESTTVRGGSCVMVVYRLATKDEAACFIRSENEVANVRRQSSRIVSAA